MATTDHHVQEMQGLYGPFTIAERVVQKIWLRRDFDQEALRLHDGRPLSIRTPGAWNLLGGPDFREARLVIGGEPVTGDVEVHFHVSDWRAHGHAADRAYDKVVLHVVLFAPARGESPACRSDGREIPTLVLLPLLHRSLEEHASDEALEALTERDAAERVAELAAMPRDSVNEILLRQAVERWRLKRHFATLRIGKLGWVGAAHHTALEILGYRRNRAAMLGVATRHPLPEWGSGLDAEEVYGERVGHWQLQGVRPSNHPRLRLRQYHRWVSLCPDWPENLRRTFSAAATSADATRATALVRREIGLPAMRTRVLREVLAGAVGGSRCDTLICDGLLPLASAESGRDLMPLWFHWFMGDIPVEVRGALGTLGIAGRGASPFCHGWGQGLLGWMAEREARASG